MKPKEIIARMESKFKMKISYMKVWDARRKAIEMIFGSYEDSYRLLLCFMEVIRLSQPRTVYNVKVVGNSRFKALFWAFGPSISGWEECRPVLSLDGTFLLGKYRGTLLAAVGSMGIVDYSCWLLQWLNQRATTHGFGSYKTYMIW
ncbi:hypothetical protein M5K25_001410 [Dendrobium thyrsiflorum]|uniref:Uncharacterized protein n=1 Tax=Dendrobium thyrsiflorum TaxID=117978 RepID=A0ABD0VZC4_DENTH